MVTVLGIDSMGSGLMVAAILWFIGHIEVVGVVLVVVVALVYQILVSIVFKKNLIYKKKKHTWGSRHFATHLELPFSHPLLPMSLPFIGLAVLTVAAAAADGAWWWPFIVIAVMTQ